MRQDWQTWSYTDKGEVQPFAGIILDCIRMTMYRFALTATSLTPEERRVAKLPPELRPEALRAKLGTPEFIELHSLKNIPCEPSACRKRKSSGAFTATHAVTNSGSVQARSHTGINAGDNTQRIEDADTGISTSGGIGSRTRKAHSWHPIHIPQ